jgi:hypothetical protein
MVLIGLIALSALAYDHQTIHGQQPGTRRNVTSGASPAITETPKGKALVEKLPEGVEGVILEKDMVKAKPGYKFVKKGNKVMLMNAGAGGVLGAGGSWQCLCRGTGNGTCEPLIVDNHLSCLRKDCSEGCYLSVVISKAKAEILRY